MLLVSLASDASLLSDCDIKKLIEEDKLLIEPKDNIHINPASIDLQLGSVLVRYPPQTIKIGFDIPLSQEIDISCSGYKLRPREFILGSTKEKVYIPNGYLGVIETKGDIARAGIQVHSNDGHIDPGFYGNITLEIKNLNDCDVDIQLISGIYICQLFIGKLSSSCDLVYAGKYSNQDKPTTYIP
jgi:dCTP deaminase